MEVVIEREVFYALVLSCAEVYHRESYGILLGTKTKKRFLVTEAMNYQTAKRGYTSAWLNPEKEKKLNAMLAELGSRKIIGDYHSHTTDRVDPFLSNSDILDMVRHGRDYLSLIVHIRNKKKSQKWKTTKEGLVGTAGEYYIKIQAFALDVKKLKIYRIPVKCSITKR
jgi:proteasome lid subunit RPN8/RPN11